MKCSCHPDTPFHWRHNHRPSIFQQDIIFRPAKTGRTPSQAATEYVEQARKEGKMAGFIKGVSKKREEEVLRMRNFSVFSLAGSNKPQSNA